MSAMLVFHQLFREASVRQIEYSFAEAEDVVTTMIPLTFELLPRVAEMARAIPFAGEWAWAVERFWNGVNPDAFLLRIDWSGGEPRAVTLYCRFSAEPDANAFKAALTHAEPFRWSGPDPSAIGASLGAVGPRGIAFRASGTGSLRTALYFRSDDHAGRKWIDRLAGLVEACGYPDGLLATIESHLNDLYQPGPVGVIGLDDGLDGIAGRLKFDPANVPLDAAFAYLARIGVSRARIAEFRTISTGFRAEAVTYLSVQFRQSGPSGWRLYFACEPSHARLPGQPDLIAQRHLRPVRRLPHY
jgi:hypothetical protein